MTKIRLTLGVLVASAVVVLSPISAHAATNGEEIGHMEHEAVKCLEEGGALEDCAKEAFEAPNPIVPAADEVLWGGAAFIVLFVLMAKFAFPMIRNTMNARTEKIRTDLDEAERTRTEASTILEEYQRQLADAKAEANRIIEEARSAAEQVRKDLVARAEAEAAELRSRNQNEIEASKDRMMVDLRDEVSGLAIELAEKVVGKNLDAQTNKALIDAYIAEVGSK